MYFLLFGQNHSDRMTDVVVRSSVFVANENGKQSTFLVCFKKSF